ncbi:MAG: hypothetical protein HYR86_12325 [Candidatus Rokubacteria bacterium]|nr:hypothetical protein [Candidatus Rokubacteria bacterium]
MSTADPRFAALLRRTLHGFFAAGLPPRFTLDVAPAGDVPGGSQPFAAFSRGGDCLHMAGDRCEGRFDYRRGAGTMTAPASPALVAAFVSAIALDYLLDDGGLVLHATAVVDAGWAVAFFGPSGSGKTTLAERLAGRGLAIVSDEAVVVRPAAEGWLAEGLPWRGRALRAPLAALVQLVQAPALAFEALDATALVRALAPNVYCTEEGGRQLGRALEIAASLAASVPCLRMRFARDHDVWPALLARLEAPAAMDAVP